MNFRCLVMCFVSAAVCACSQAKVQPAPKMEPTAKQVRTTVVSKSSPAKASSDPILTKAQAQARLSAGATLIDARSADEFAAGAAPKAINVPLELLEPTLPALASYKNKEILVVGKDSPQVEAMRKEMQKAGFKRVFNAVSLNQ